MSLLIGTRRALLAGRGAVAYSEKVMGYGPIAYWPLWEAAGAAAVDQVNSPAQDGTYIGVTLGQPGIGDGNTAPLFDGLNDYINIYSVALNAAWAQTESTLSIWVKVFNIGVWTDGANRNIVRLRVNGTNGFRLTKGAPNDHVSLAAVAQGAAERYAVDTPVAETDWTHYAVTMSEAANEIEIFRDGISQEVSAPTYTGTWAGNLDNTGTVIGSKDTAPSWMWYGWLAHCAVFTTVLTQPQIADLATV